MSTAFQIGGTSVRRGERRGLEIPVARLPTGTVLSLPVSVVRGRARGPTIWINAALHGDEVNGVEIIQEVLRHLDPAAMRGTVIAVPVVNVFGFVMRSRYLPDRRDLNRSFPGSATGALASRLAHLFLTEVVDRCAYGIDLHSASDNRTNYPHIRCDLDEPETAQLAAAFGTRLIVHAKQRAGSLREAAGKRGIRCLVYEAGEALRFEERTVTPGVHGILRVLHALDMRDEPGPAVPTPPIEIRKTSWLRAPISGILRLTVAPGDDVKRSQAVGSIGDAFGDEHAELRAPFRGVVLGVALNPLLHRGDAAVHIARTD